jgi:hypothetical protein
MEPSIERLNRMVKPKAAATPSFSLGTEGAVSASSLANIGSEPVRGTPRGPRGSGRVWEARAALLASFRAHSCPFRALEKCLLAGKSQQGAKLTFLWARMNAALLQRKRLTAPPRLRGREVGGVEMVLLDALAPGGRLASLSDSLEISRVWPPSGYRIVDPVAEAVGKDRVLEASMAPFSL